MQFKSNVLLSGSIILILSNVLTRGLDFLYRVLMGRMLTAHEFGLLNLALPFQYLLIVVAGAGIAPAIGKHVAQYRESGTNEKVLEVISSGIFYYGIIGLIFGGLVLLLSWPLAYWVFHEPALLPLLMVSALGAPFVIMISTFTGTFQGFQRMDLMSYTLLGALAARVVGAVVLVWLSYEVVGAMLGSSIGLAMGVPIGYLFFKKIGLVYTKASRVTFHDLFWFSVPASMMAIAHFMLAFTDMFFLGAMETPTIVGIYAAASPTARILYAFSIAISTTVLPLIAASKARKNTKEIRTHVVQGLKYLATFSVPVFIGLYIFAEPVIQTLFGVTYIAAVEPFRVLLIGSLILSPFILASGAFMGLGKPKVPMYVLLVIGALNIALNALWIPSIGIMGAAYATAVSGAAAGIGLILLLWREV